MEERETAQTEGEEMELPVDRRPVLSTIQVGHLYLKISTENERGSIFEGN